MNIDINSLLSILAAIIGWIVLALVSAYSIPQLLRVIKTRDTSGLSIPGYCLFICSNLGMLIWGIGNTIRSTSAVEYNLLLVIMALIPNIILNSLNTCINVFILSTKIRHVRLAQKMGIDEAKLSSILLRQKKKNKKRKGDK